MKKCVMQKRRRNAAPRPCISSVIRRPEVLDATMACFATCGAILPYRSSFQSMRSAIASITRSHSPSRAMCSS